MAEKRISWIYEIIERLHPQTIKLEKGRSTVVAQLITTSAEKIKTFIPYYINQLAKSEIQAKMLLMQIVSASNSIYNYLTILNKIECEQHFSAQIRMCYLKLLTLLEMLLETCGKFNKAIFLQIPLTTHSISSIRMELRIGLNVLRLIVAESEVNPKLGEVLLGGLKRLIEREGINRSEAKYASSILEEFQKLKPFNTIEVENLLYQYDFNTPSFFNYYAKYCNRLIVGTPSLHEQLEILIGLEDRISSLPARCTSKWMTKDESVREQIRTLLGEKKQNIRQRIELRRFEIQDAKLTDKAERAQVNLPVAQFGLLIRLFMEKGLLPNEEVGKTFAYYARHFSTPKTPFISAESLQKKSTDVEFSTAKKMKSHLIGMVNWLNERYNVSNHRDS